MLENKEENRVGQLDTTNVVARKFYAVTVRRLHWLMAIMIITLLVLGFYSSGLPMHGVQFEHMGRHAMFGSGVLVFAIIRLYAKIKNFKNNPHLPKKFARFEKISAILTHYVFYLLFILMPLSGWIMMNGLNIKLTLMGIPLPHLLPVSKTMGTWALYFHITTVYGIIFLVLAHVVGTFWHMVKDKENLLNRLNPLMTTEEQYKYNLAVKKMKIKDQRIKDQRIKDQRNKEKRQAKQQEKQKDK